MACQRRHGVMLLTLWQVELFPAMRNLTDDKSSWFRHLIYVKDPDRDAHSGLSWHVSLNPSSLLISIHTNGLGPHAREPLTTHALLPELERPQRHRGLCAALFTAVQNHQRCPTHQDLGWVLS